MSISEPLSDETQQVCSLVNGELAKDVSLHDRGFTYGDGVFRTIRIEDGKLCFWDAHFVKLHRDAASLGLSCPDQAVLYREAQQLLKVPSSGLLKIILTRGPGNRGYAIPPFVQPTRVMTRSALPQFPNHYAETGVDLALCRLRLGHQPLLAGIKHLNRLENILARSEWQGQDFADGVLLDSHGQVIECTSSNILCRFGNRLMTPDLSNCGVAGVTRDLILQNASDIGLVAEIGSMPLETLMQADDVMICNSAFGVWQVRNFNGKTWTRSGLAPQMRDLLSSLALMSIISY